MSGQLEKCLNQYFLFDFRREKTAGLPEPVGAGVFGRSRSRNFHPAPAPALASTNTVEIFTNKSPKDFFFTLNY